MIRARTRIALALAAALVASSCGLVLGSQGASDQAHRDLGPKEEVQDAANPLGGVTDETSPRLDENGNPLVSTTLNPNGNADTTTTTGPNGELPPPDQSQAPPGSVLIGTTRSGQPIYAPITTTIPVPKIPDPIPPDTIYPPERADTGPGPGDLGKLVQPRADVPPALLPFCTAVADFANTVVYLMLAWRTAAVSSADAATLATAYARARDLTPLSLTREVGILSGRVGDLVSRLPGMIGFVARTEVAKLVNGLERDLSGIADACFNGYDPNRTVGIIG